MTILDDILRHKRDEVAALPDCAPQPSTRDFVAGLRTASPCLIAEVKPKSPSAGPLLDRANVPALMESYNRHAQAVSVLCDERFFGGGFDLLRQVRALTDLPILAKEFIVDAKQIRVARDAGADAVLLIANVLSANEILRFSAEATGLGMGVLLELHDESDLEKIPAMHAGTLVLGINNRSLATLHIDLDTTARLSPLVRTLCPGHLVIGESGVTMKADLARLQPSVDGFLIGTGLLAGTMLGAFPPHRP
ncbi:MAG TPA: indole-3-glycerol phosphate synthase TrpC [Candidatus Peribacteria bacterium]|nr:indole-3-glycerol phosphate synthase TrpC [Candidatus Peribacteria bacterium]